MKTLYSLLILSIFLTSCDDEKTIHVANHYADCSETTHQTCLLIKEDENKEWTTFHDVIEGFSYEEGYEYTLKVKISKDTSSSDNSDKLQYKLIEIMSKEKASVTETDKQSNATLYGQWTVSSIKNYSNKTGKWPHFIIKEGNISGNTGCNSFGGKIEIDENGLFKPGPLAATKMYCAETAALERSFTTAMSKANSYIIKDNTMIIYDKAKEALLTASTKGETALKQSNDSILIKYSATSRGSGSSITFNAGRMNYEVVRPTQKKTSIRLSKTQMETMDKLISKLNLEGVKNLKPPSQDHQFDGASHGVITITVAGKEYRTPTFDYGNPPAALKEIADFLVKHASK